MIYLFFASLNAEKEFPIFFNELLGPLNLTMEKNEKEILDSLSSISFNT
jgi:hypothetical protein